MLRDVDGSVRLIHDRHHTGLYPSATWIDVLGGAGFEVTSVLEPDTVDWEPRELFIGIRP
jgi:hypothetical protein